MIFDTELDQEQLAELELYDQKAVQAYQQCLKQRGSPTELENSRKGFASLNEKSLKDSRFLASASLLKKYMDLRTHFKLDSQKVLDLRDLIEQQNYEEALSHVVRFLSGDPSIPEPLKTSMKEKFDKVSYEEKIDLITQYWKLIYKLNEEKKLKRSPTGVSLLSDFLWEAKQYFALDRNSSMKTYINTEKHLLKLEKLESKKNLYHAYLDTLLNLIENKLYLKNLYSHFLTVKDFRIPPPVKGDTSNPDVSYHYVMRKGIEQWNIEEKLRISLSTQELAKNCAKILVEIGEDHPRGEIGKLRKIEERDVLECGGSGYWRMLKDAVKWGSKGGKAAPRTLSNTGIVSREFLKQEMRSTLLSYKRDILKLRAEMNILKQQARDILGKTKGYQQMMKSIQQSVLTAAEQAPWLAKQNALLAQGVRQGKTIVATLRTKFSELERMVNRYKRWESQMKQFNEASRYVSSAQHFTKNFADANKLFGRFPRPAIALSLGSLLTLLTCSDASSKKPSVSSSADEGLPELPDENLSKLLEEPKADENTHPWDQWVTMLVNSTKIFTSSHENYVAWKALLEYNIKNFD